MLASRRMLSVWCSKHGCPRVQQVLAGKRSATYLVADSAASLRWRLYAGAVVHVRRNSSACQQVFPEGLVQLKWMTPCSASACRQALRTAVVIC
jgi:hypothetical protein